MSDLQNEKFSNESKNLLFIGIQSSQQLDIRARLSELNFNYTFCDTAAQAMQELKSVAKPNLEAFILDETVLSHIDFDAFYNYRKQPGFNAIPMILQINNTEDFSLGQKALENGIYFSLSYPYSSTLFNSVLRAANHGFSQRLEASHRLSNFEKLRPLVQNAVFHARTIQDAQTISSVLAFLTPDQKRVSVGLFELILNAIEHGNLGIGYAEKSNLTINSALQQEIERRLNLPENLSKYVTVTVKRYKGQLQFSIKDCGNGFDYSSYLDFSANRSMDHHGRGIMIANQLSFDHMEYKDNGSKVICKVNL